MGAASSSAAEAEEPAKEASPRPSTGAESALHHASSMDQRASIALASVPAAHLALLPGGHGTALYPADGKSFGHAIPMPDRLALDKVWTPTWCAPDRSPPRAPSRSCLSPL